MALRKFYIRRTNEKERKKINCFPAVTTFYPTAVFAFPSLIRSREITPPEGIPVDLTRRD